MPRPSAREKLVAAAVTSFQVNGFKACTIEDIADRAGVFKGSFYNHFKSKEALAITTVKNYVAGGLETLSMEESTSAVERLRKHFEALRTANNVRTGCLLANFSAEISAENASLQLILESAWNEWSEALSVVIRQGQAGGEIDSRHNPDGLARFIINAWEGACVRTKVTQNGQALSDFFTIIFEGIFKAESK